MDKCHIHVPKNLPRRISGWAAGIHAHMYADGVPRVESDQGAEKYGIAMPPFMTYLSRLGSQMLKDLRS